MLELFVVQAYFLIMEQVRRIELPSQPWQGRILTIILHLRVNNISKKNAICKFILRLYHDIINNTDEVRK